MEQLRKELCFMNTHHIIITGASRGIGQAIALLYASMGWNISICCRHKSPDMEHTKAQITAAGGQYFAFYGDMGNPEDAEAFVTKSVQTFGIPEIFVNNAGISHIGLLQDMTPQQWDDLLHTNLSSVFYTSRIIIPYFLQEKHGRIINISSVWGNVGASTEAAYSASKGGLNALTKALAKELAPSGIPVNAIACGMINTSMNAFLDPDELSALTEEIPAGRAGTPEEAAALVRQVAEAPEYMTGQIITLDGGWI